MTTTTAVQGERCVIAVVLDRLHARFFEVTSAGEIELSCLQSPATRGGRFHSDRGGSPGSGEHGYHGRIVEEERRHFGAVTRELEALMRRRSTGGLLIAGPGITAAAFRRRLPPELARRVVGTARLNPLEVTPPIVGTAARRALARRGRANGGS